MATLKRRLARKNASGIYEPVHLETSSGLVICPDGTNLDTALSKKSPIDHTHTGFALTGHTHEIYVPNTRKINGKALSGDISLAAADVGASASGHTHTLSSLGAAASSHSHNGYVPTSRTINGKALGGNITLTPEDIGAASVSQLASAGGLNNVLTSSIKLEFITSNSGGKITTTIPAMPNNISSKNSAHIIDYIYNLRIIPNDGGNNYRIGVASPNKSFVIPVACTFNLRGTNSTIDKDFGSLYINIINGIVTFTFNRTLTDTEIYNYYRELGTFASENTSSFTITINHLVA